MSLEEKNAEFWEELCGSQLARSLGIHDNSRESIKRFDKWYFLFYPYLTSYLSGLAVKNKSVLEVGLGYGTVTQALAEMGASVHAIDIAAGPVIQAQRRFSLNHLAGMAHQQSILGSDFPDESFDAVVCIGSLHHTGDLRQSLSEIERLLRPGGNFLIMVYNAYSYRRWVKSPFATTRYFLSELVGHRGVVSTGSAKERGHYDRNLGGDSAPHTDWISRKSLSFELRTFEGVSITRENIDQEFPFSFVRRERLLKTCLPKLFGLDLYAVGIKPRGS